MRAHPTSKRSRLALAAVAAATAALILSSCAGTPQGASDDGDGELLVWTDATRQPGFEEYQKQHPDVKLKIETYDPATLLSKIQLFNQTGEGWPDVIFDAVPNEIASLANPTFDFAQPLDDLVPKDVQDGFGTSNDGCTIDGKLYCLKNDLAQSVLWYDKTLMEEFGYEVPTTWDEYAELGERVAAEHPGYIIGTAGFSFVYYDFFWSSGCPIQTVTESQTVQINTEDDRCTRVADLLDPLLDAGVVARSGPFDADVTELGKQGKILMMPGASWYGDFVFKPEASYALPEGRLAAATYPTWEGEDKAWSGATGGGVFVVSKHSDDQQAAADVAQWMTTDVDYQSAAATYPAYGPAAEKWNAAKATDPFYAEDPTPALVAQAQLINPAESNTAYSVEEAFTSTVVSAVRGGDSIASALPALQTQLTQLAQSVGYIVEK